MIETITEVKEVKVANTVEIVGDNLMVNGRGRERLTTFLPTVKIPLDHVLGTEKDPEIQKKLWRARALGQGNACIVEPGVRFYNPRRGNREKAIVIRLKDDVCERLVVEVQDPNAVVAMINQAV